ncbi:uncharacterized protein PG986_001210 [Apiospora aurea]|uniref:Uncharacterized protein n=1 Tax=Apiospora aurea TaxID=335848 RepID=A0ABR1QWY0_9PEZI
MFADEKQAREPPRGGPGASIGAEETDAVEWKFDEQIFTSSDFPEGRREDWLAVFGAWCLVFCTFGLVSWVFLDDYKKGPLAADNPGAVSWITSLQAFVQTGGSALAVRLLRPALALLIGAPLYRCGLMMLSLSGEHYQTFLAHSIVVALGSGAIFTTSPISTTS